MSTYLLDVFGLFQSLDYSCSTRVNTATHRGPLYHRSGVITVTNNLESFIGIMLKRETKQDCLLPVN